MDAVNGSVLKAKSNYRHMHTVRYRASIKLRKRLQLWVLTSSTVAAALEIMEQLRSWSAVLAGTLLMCARLTGRKKQIKKCLNFWGFEVFQNKLYRSSLESHQILLILTLDNSIFSYNLSNLRVIYTIFLKMLPSWQLSAANNLPTRQITQFWTNRSS